MKCVLHFGNGVFNSLAPVKRGDGVDQVEEERMDGERAREVEQGVREARCAFFWCLLPKKTWLSSAVFHPERCVVGVRAARQQKEKLIPKKSPRVENVTLKH